MNATMRDSDGGVTISTPEQFDFFNLARLRGMLRLELAGMKCHGPSAYAQAKRLYNLTGSRESVLAALCAMIETAKEFRA